MSNIQVGIKVRPLPQKEKESQILWRVTENSISLGPTESSYCFDHVFDQNSSNQLIFNKMAKHIVHSAVEGFNGTIFAYGQTSSGKTYTMMGNKHDPGVMVLAAKEIFETIERASDTRQFLLRVGFIEIYNEKIYDLLNKSNQDLKMHEASNGNVHVNCHEICVTSEEHLLKVLETGNKERTVGETNMNERSSRSHSILRLTIESRDVSKDEDGDVTQGLLHLVDLAGSERADQTGARGVRLLESGNINKSLLFLSQVIKRLSEHSDAGYINYRDSKLTRILQASLGGNAFTSIICTVKPNAIEETQSTLNFATRAKTIKNKPRVNAIVSDAAEMKRLEREIEKLRRQLEEEQKKSASQIKLSHIEALLNVKQHNIINSSTLHRSRNRKDNRRRTWCPDVANTTVSAILSSPADNTASTSACSKAPNVLTTPLVVMRGPVNDVRPQSSLNMLSEEFQPGEEFDFGKPISPNTSPALDIIVHDDSISPITLNKSQHIRIIENDLRQLEEFTNLENKVVDDHDLYKSLKQSIDSVCKRNKDLEREHMDYLLMKDELDKINDDFTNSKNRCDDLEVQISKLKVSNVNADNKIKEYESKIFQLQKTIENLEVENRNAVELQFEFNRRQKKAQLRESDLLQALEEKERELAKLESKFKLYQDEKTAELMQLSHCVVGNGNGTATDRQQNVNPVCSKCEDMQRVLEENKNVKLEFEKLTSQFRELQASYEKSVNQTQAKQQQLAQLESDLNRQLSEECDELRKEVIELRQKLESFKTVNYELLFERDEKAERCGVLNRELELVQQKYEYLETKYSNLECNWQKQEAELLTIRADYANLESKYNEMQRAYDNLKACETKCAHEFESLQLKNDELQKEIQQLKLRIEQMQQELLGDSKTSKECEKIAELQNKCEKFKEENEQLSMDILDHIEANETLMKKYKKLEAELENLQTALKLNNDDMQQSSILENRRANDATFMETCADLENKLIEAETKQKDWLLEKAAFESQIQSLEAKIVGKTDETKTLQSAIEDLRSKNEFLQARNESLIETSENTIMNLREEVLRLCKELLEKSTILETCLENCSCAEISQKIDRANLSQFNELLQERIMSSQLELSGVNGANVTRNELHESSIKLEPIPSLPKLWINGKSTLETDPLSLEIKNDIKIERQSSPTMSNSSIDYSISHSGRPSWDNKTLCPQEMESAALSQSISSVDIDAQNSQLIKSLKAKLKNKEELCAHYQLEILEKLNEAENGFRENLRTYNKEWEQSRLQYESRIHDLEQALAQQSEKYASEDHNDISLSSSFISKQEQQEDHQHHQRQNTCSTPTSLSISSNQLNVSSASLTEKQKIRAERAQIIAECKEQILELSQSVKDLKAANLELSNALAEKTKQLEEQEKFIENATTQQACYEVALIKAMTECEILKLEAVIDYKAEHLRNTKVQDLKKINYKSLMNSKEYGDRIGNEFFDLLSTVKECVLKRNNQIQKLEKIGEKLKDENSIRADGSDFLANLNDRFEPISQEIFQLKHGIENMAEQIDGKIAKLENLYENIKIEAVKASAELQFKEKIAESDRTIAQMETTIKQKESELAQLKVEKAALEKDLKEIEIKMHELEETKQQNAFFETEYKSQKAMLNEIKQQNEELQEKLCDLRNAHEAAIAALQLEKETIKSELKVTKEECAKALEELETSNLKSEAREQELYALKQQAQNLTKTISEYEVLENELEKVNKSKAELVDEFNQLRVKENANNAELETLKDEIKVHKGKEQKLQRELIDLQLKLKSDQQKYEREAQELLSHVKEWQLKCENLESANIELEKTCTDLKQKIANFEMAHKTVQQQHEQIAKLENENERLISRMKALETSTTAKNAEFEEELKERHAAYNKMSELLDAKNKDFKEKLTRLEATNTCLRDQNKQLSERLEALNQMSKNTTSTESANNFLEVSNTSNSSRRRSPAGKFLSVNANGEDMNAAMQKERKNRRLSQHDENRRQSAQFTPILNDVATMTVPIEETCECNILREKLKDMEKELYIKKSQVTACTLELRNNPLILDNANLVKRIQEEQRKYSVMYAKYKSKVEEQTTKIRELEIQANLATSKPVVSAAETQTESEIEAALHELEGRYRDLKKICRSRRNEIREYEQETKELKQKLSEKENRFYGNSQNNGSDGSNNYSNATTQQSTLTESSISNVGLQGPWRDVKKNDSK